MSSDKLIPLSQVPKVLESMVARNKPYAPKTIHRWATVGLKGRKLKTNSSLGHRTTTATWLREFLQLPTTDEPATANDDQRSSFPSRV